MQDHVIVLVVVKHSAVRLRLLLKLVIQANLNGQQGEDKVQQYESEKGWGLGFCKVCGSTLCGLFKGNVMGVTLGTIDGDPGIEIEKHIFVGSKAPWDHIGGTAPQFEEWGNGA